MMMLVVLFTWIHQRDRQQRVRLWMIGWIAICAHSAAALFDSFHLVSPPLAHWLAYSTLLAAAASFLVSVCKRCVESSRQRVFLGLLLGPALVYAGLVSWHATTPFLYILILLIMSSAGFYLAREAFLQSGAAGWATALFSFCSVAWTVWMAGAEPAYGFDLILFAAFAATARLFWLHHRRLSPGVTLTSFSFLLWGMVFPVASLAAYLHVGIPGDHVVWALPQYAVAFGMILSLFENQEELLRVQVLERKRAEDMATASSDAKSQFLARMSHEIRTPMNGIIGMTQLVQDTPLTSEQRDSMAVIRHSAESLLRLIDDILDLSKIEAGKLSFEKVEFDLPNLFSDLEPLMRLRAEQKGLLLLHEVDSDVPRAIFGDPGRLRQVLLNLISNAIKFTKHGHVLLKVERKAPPLPGEVLLRFSVKDSGIGIPPEKQSVIFEPFYQVDDSIAHRLGGSGLGLTIASELVSLMGGELKMEPVADGEGSKFTFEIRFGLSEERVKATKQLAMAAAASSSGRASTGVRTGGRASMLLGPLRILLAEDNPVNQLVATRLMEKQGFSVTVAASGGQALDALNRDSFDVILMDVHMPDLDGIQATRMIRASERFTGRHIPIIAVTALAMKGDAEKCLEAGMDAYISKPIEASELLGKIKELV